jgi:hypothetical protein
MFPFRDDDDRYPPKFRAAWKHEFGLDVFTSDHLASLFDRIANPDDYRPPAGVKLPPGVDPETSAKRVLHRFIDTLNSGNMDGAIDRLRRATIASRAEYPRTEAVVMLCYYYLVESGREASKKSLWDAVNECREKCLCPPLHVKTRERLLKSLGLENLPKGRWTKRRKGDL